ncbi:MAG: NAD-dependent epimerase/dehydratase family protein [bacterium]
MMSRTVLVTGADGFVGRNLCAVLSTMRDLQILRYDLGNPPDELPRFAAEADFVFHLAGVNRPQDPAEFKTGNADLTSHLLDLLRAVGRRPPVVLSSSIQAAIENPYGVSKRQAEDAVKCYGEETGSPVYVFRLPNVFGKWCRPNYNSAVATWCHSIARDIPIQVRDREAPLTLVYVDDVVRAFLDALDDQVQRKDGYCFVPTSYTVALGQVVDLIASFKRSRQDFLIPDQGDAFARKLYATYLAALPEQEFSYPLKMNVDDRGSFTEILKTPDRGQVSVNISKPYITKGDHWHHSKNEKFLVVSGRGVIRFRRIGDTAVHEYFVSGDKLEVVDIPPGYTHNIENLADTDMVTVMWCNEMYDPLNPDTFIEKV